MRKHMLIGILAATCLARSAGAENTPPQTQAEMQAAFMNTLHRLSDYLAATPDVVVAEIGGRTVTRGDVAETLTRLPPSNGMRTVDQVFAEAVRGLLAQRALYVRAAEMGIDKDPAIARRVEAEREALVANEYLRRTVAKTITDEALQAAYQRQLAAQAGSEQVRARVIMTPARDGAEKALNRLRAGSDFAQVAAELSQDASAPAGGDIGFVSFGSVLPELSAVIFALAPGQIASYPIWAGGAWYVVKVEARRLQPPPSFETLRGPLTVQLSREGTAGVVEQAIRGLNVQEYGVTGKPPNK